MNIDHDTKRIVMPMTRIIVAIIVIMMIEYLIIENILDAT